MGGFYGHSQCIERLRRAAQELFNFGFQDEAEAVEQAIVLLEARPNLTDEVFEEVSKKLRSKT